MNVHLAYRYVRAHIDQRPYCLLYTCVLRSTMGLNLLNTSAVLAQHLAFIIDTIKANELSAGRCSDLACACRDACRDVI